MIRSRVLVIDDDRSALDTTRAQLAAEPYDLTCAHGGREALQLVGQEPPDLVICDLAMPDVDGLEVCRT
ncbi:MAG TPA: response regulator, partial [Kofleriaceae bacterium]